MAGIDLSVGGSWTLGVALGSERLRNKVDDRNADSDVDALHAGLYTGFRGESFWLNGGASYADYRTDTQRRVGTGQAWAQTLDGRQDASAITGFAEGGWDIELDALTLTPYLALAYTRLSSDAFAETGGSAALAVDSSEDTAWTTTAGLRAAWDISADQEGGTRIEAGLAWQHAGGDLRADTSNRFVAGSDRFTVSGLPLAGDVAIAELGFSFKPTDNSRLSFFAQGRSGDGTSEFGGQLNWNILF
jgi:outer membrane autotransporter protein